MPAMKNRYRTSIDEDAPSYPVPDLSSLSKEQMRDALLIRDRVISEMSPSPAGDDFLSLFGEMLREAGIQVDRIAAVFETLHSEYVGIGRFWTWNEGTTTHFVRHGEQRLSGYMASPFAFANRVGDWLLLDLNTMPDSSFPIIPDLKALGYQHYLVVPMSYANESKNALGFASKSPFCFDPVALAILNIVIPTLTLVMELRSANARAENLLRTYVGNEPRQEILSGIVRRGQVTRIRSAILFADMRDYTRIAAVQTPEETVELLDTYFDCVVPCVEDNGGEVLKYIGDGILAIFRDYGDDTGSAAYSALEAAMESLHMIDRANETGRFKTPVSIGIALHHGEAAYGNVGSGSRLDFTVIGPDVNLASRLARMNRELHEPLLTTRSFANQLWYELELIGSFGIPGLKEPLDIFRPPRHHLET